MNRTTAHIVPPIALGILAVVVLAGCSASPAEPAASDETASYTVEVNSTADAANVDLLPSAVADKGVLEIATTDANAPWVFFDTDTNEAKGVDADLLNEAADRLGLTVNWTNVQFTAGIPGVESGRYDMYVSAMADSLEREKVVDFIGYSEEGSGVVVAKGNPQGIETMEDLCGKTVSFVTGSIFPATIDELNADTCAADPVTVSETADQTGPYLAVASGQADATMNTYGVSNYAFKTATDGVQSQLEVSPVPRFAPANQGIAFSKDNSDLLAAVSGALQEMVEDGTYQEIMDSWNVGDGALDNILINTATF